MTLSDYLLSEIKQIAEKPTLSEMMERLRSREPAELDEPQRSLSVGCAVPTILATSAKVLRP
jgi:hypothetical protein